VTRLVNFRLVLSTVAALGLAAALGACSASSASSPAPRPATASTAPATASAAPLLGCAWYTPLAPPGQVVNVTATGPACHDQSLIGWLASDTDRPWASESVIPGSFGTLLAQMARNGSVVRVWFTGPAVTPVASPATPGATLAAPQAAALAGRIADALQAAGWTPETPT
jgi:hypothetical protein